MAARSGWSVRPAGAPVLRSVYRLSRTTGHPAAQPEVTRRSEHKLISFRGTIPSMFTYFISLFFCSALAFTATAQTFPALTYSSFLRNNFTPRAIATDSAGNIYVAGGAILDESTAQN